MEKEHQPDSMATITMKPEYPASEYSASEPPPAYRQGPSSSVQIARIAALTVVAASFILGSFILASSWVAVRASCHQLEQLDAMLDKELALENKAYGNDALFSDEPLPVANAHALHGVPPPAPAPAAPAEPAQHTAPPAPAPAPASHTKEDSLNQAESKIDEDNLQKIDENDSNQAKPDLTNASSDESSESDSSAEDGDDELDAIRPMFKLPVQFNLDELAEAFLANNQQNSAEDGNDELGAIRPMFKLPVQVNIDELAEAFLANNQQKGRMNCVVERRRDEPMDRRPFPFNILGAFTPRNAHAERIAIVCHGADEPRSMSFPEPQSQVFAFPMGGPVRLPLRPQPERAPASDRMPSSPFMHRPSQFPIPMPWDSSEEQGSPREMRIHVQRVIAIPAPAPAPHNLPPPENMPMGNMGPFAPPPPPQRDQNEQPTILHQFVPQNAPTQELEQPEIQKVQMEGTPVMNLPWGLTPEDLHVIHRTAENAAAAAQRREQGMDNDMQEVKTIVNTLAAAAEAEAEAQAQAEEHQRQEAQRQEARIPQDAGFMQDLPQELPQGPRAPRTLLLPQEMPQPMEERPHYMQPRSVRVDASRK